MRTITTKEQARRDQIKAEAEEAERNFIATRGEAIIKLMSYALEAGIPSEVGWTNKYERGGYKGVAFTVRFGRAFLQFACTQVEYESVQECLETEAACLIEDRRISQVRQTALAKLTKEEREILGLK